jgi:hypothetical protein
MEALGTDTARAEALADPEGMLGQVKTIIEHQTLQAQLTPLRSWRRKNERYRRIISEIDCRFTILLFLPDGDDLSVTVPDGDEVSEDDSVVPAGRDRIYFLSSQEDHAQLTTDEVFIYGDLNDLVSHAWRRFRDEPASSFVEIASPEVSAVYLGLARALNDDIPLRFGVSQQTESNTESSVWSKNFAAEEIVLIESIEDAENLSGVLYARLRGAPLVCTNAPDLDRIEIALKAINTALGQTGGLAAEQSILNPHAPSASSQKRFRDWFRNLGGLVGPAAVEGCICELEAAATVHLSDEQLKAIGSRRVTALTAGVPYNFVNRGEYTWKNKPVGHLTGDKSLVLLTELWELEESQKHNYVSINLVFDPGYFQTTETENVVQELHRHHSHSIVLDGDTADSSSLMYLAQVLPLELVFFNTHGADDAIMLGHGPPLYNHLLVQWVSFHSYPLIINNSCLSWIGVGREFLRVGARGYIGTLWSVDARLAAHFARHALHHMVLEDQTAAAAIASFAGSEPDSRAYLFAGSANGRMSSRPVKDRGVEFRYQACRLFASGLLQLVGHEERLQAATAVLEREFQSFLAPLMDAAPSADALLILQELQLLVWAARKPTTDTSVVDGLAHRLFDGLKASIAEDAPQRLSAAYSVYSRILEARGDVVAAAEYLKRDAPHSEGDRTEESAARYLRLAELLIAATDVEGARAAALVARSIYSELENHLAVLILDGRLGQISKRLGQTTEAMEYARHGFATAVESGNYYQQCAFKADEAQLLLGSNKPHDALKAANEALRLARGNQDKIGELKLTGIIGHCYLVLQDFSRAEQQARAGLSTAETLKQPGEIAAFCADLGTISARQKKFVAANGWFMRGLDPAEAAGNYELYFILYRSLMENAASLRDWQAFAKAALVHLMNIDRIEADARSVFSGLFIDALRAAMSWSERAEVEKQLGLLETLAAIVAKDRDETSDDFKLSFLAIRLHLMWLQGDSTQARQVAEMLDGISGNIFGFQSYIGKNLPQHEKSGSWLQRSSDIFKRRQSRDHG